MRVAVCLLLLACCGGLVSAQVDTINPDSANTFHITNGASGSGWTITGSSNVNPTLNMTIGTTYYISIEFNTADASHPFGLNTDSASLTTTELGLVNNGSCGGSVTPYTSSGTAPFCVLTFTPTQSTPQPLYYHCATHISMKGQILLNMPPTTPAPTTAAPTTAAPTNNGTTTPVPTTPVPTTAAPTTPAPTNNNTNNGTTNAPTTTAPTTPAPITPIAGGTLAGSSFRITGNIQASSFVFTDPNGALYSNPTLNVTGGSTVTISLEYSTFHPLGFSNNSNPTAFSLYDFPLNYLNYTLTVAANCNTTFSSTINTVRMATTGIATPTPCVITIKVPTAAIAIPNLYYRCARHAAMVGTINVVAPITTPTTPAPTTGSPTPTPKSGTPSTFTPQSMFGTGVAIMIGMFAMLMA